MKINPNRTKAAAYVCQTAMEIGSSSPAEVMSPSPALALTDDECRHLAKSFVFSYETLRNAFITPEKARKMAETAILESINGTIERFEEVIGEKVLDMGLEVGKSGPMSLCSDHPFKLSKVSLYLNEDA